jgi:PST family polysaccharide transporter
MYVTLETAQSALTVAASRWRPDLRAGGGAAVAPLLRFGGMMMAFDFLGYVNLKLDNLIVAWYLGPAALGYYDKAYQFLLLPVNQIGMPISSVAHTALSRSRAALDHYRAAFDRLLLLNAGLGMPVTAFLAVNTSAVVALVLGEKWTPSVPIFHALAPAALLMTVTTCVGWIFLSLGRAGRQLRWGALLTAATLAAYFVGVRWGAVGVAAGVSAVRIALFLPTLVYTCAGSPIGVGQILRVVSLPALASAAAMAASLAADRWLGPGAWALPRNAALFCAAYALVWMAAPSGRAALAGLPLFAKIPVER